MRSLSKHLCSVLLLSAVVWMGCALDPAVSDDAGTSTDSGNDTGEECSPEEFAAQQEALEEAVFAVDPCFWGPASIDEDGNLQEMTFDLTFCMGFGFMYCNDSYQHSEEVEQAAAGVDLSCGEGDAPGVWSDEASDQLGLLIHLVVEHGCHPPISPSNHVVVVVGADGSIATVYPVGEVVQEDLDCVGEALAGQVFSCLSELEFCSCYGGLD